MIRIGFVGTGTITECVVSGLCLKDAEDLAVTVSPRNKEKAESLASRFPAQVRVASDNQQVLDQSDIVCIAVTPQLAPEIVSLLNFRADHVVVSFMSTVRIEKLKELVRGTDKILRAVPMPPFAKRVGGIPLHPPHDLVSSLFSRAVKVIQVETEDELMTLMSVSGTMAPFYQLLATTSEWIVKQGVTPQASSQFVGALFHSYAEDSKDLEEGFQGITAESQTPGGINEQALRELKAAGWYDKFEEELEVIAKRVRGK